MSKKTVIVSGGMLEEDFVLPILKSEETEFVIGVDKGLEFLYKHEIKPDYIVGDFDSVSRELVDYYREELNVPIREFNPVKDASDTEIALRLCLGLNRKIHLDPGRYRQPDRPSVGECTVPSDCASGWCRRENCGQS